MSAIYLTSGAQAAGKSSVARALAARFPVAAHVEGDLLWKMVVAGRADMTPDPSPEALAQLRLRYRNGAMLADAFAAAGVVAIHTDIVMGDDLAAYPAWVRTRPLHLVMLRPSIDEIERREIARGGTTYRDWVTGGRTLRDAIAVFDRWVEDSPRIGITVDSTGQDVAQTVDEILARTLTP